MARELPAAAVAATEARALVQGPFDNQTPIDPVPIGGALEYAFDGDGVRLTSGELATADTFVTFAGATNWAGEGSRIPFHVTSANWQESDRFLAGTDDRVRVVDARRGDGRRRRVRRRADRRISPAADRRSFQAAARCGPSTSSGATPRATSSSRIPTRTSATAVITRGASRMEVAGQFSLGYPRRDGGEEINARIKIDGRPLADLLNAFDLEGYPVTGTLSGDFHLYGPYTRPLGFGRMSIDRGTAYGERFTTASAGLRFEGVGVRMDGIEIAKGPAAITGAAYVGWNGTYSFNTEARALPVEALDVASFPDLPPLTGVARVLGERERDIRRAALRREGRRAGSVLRRGRHRRSDGAALGPR